MSSRVLMTYSRREVAIQDLPSNADAFDISNAVYQLAQRLSQGANIVPESIRFKVVKDD